MESRKRILIISANPLSTTSNNGKTVASIFETYPRELLAQLYFSDMVPDSGICDNYYKISDMDMLKSRLSPKKGVCGACIRKMNINEQNMEEPKNHRVMVRKNNFTRLLREFVWNKNWRTDELISWLDSFKPELVFFVAGDGVFSYKIAFYVIGRYQTKSAIYITDDYILPRVTFSVFWWIRRFWIYRYMKRGINGADVFLTISPLMQEKYEAVFGRQSYVAANMPGFLVHKDFCAAEEDNIIMVYAGGLHLNRDKTLLVLADAIARLNREAICGRKIILEIYSNQRLAEKQKKDMESSGYCVFCGGIGPNELAGRLQQADFLIHVESFRYKNVCDTRLSLSTKIPEYMSAGKPIIAIGPSHIASMKYLLGCACCITGKKEVYSKIYGYIFDKELQRQHIENAWRKYMEYHDEINRQRLLDVLQAL